MEVDWTSRIVEEKVVGTDVEVKVRTVDVD